jgi:hypothetical protein
MERRVVSTAKSRHEQVYLLKETCKWTQGTDSRFRAIPTSKTPSGLIVASALLNQATANGRTDLASFLLDRKIGRQEVGSRNAKRYCMGCCMGVLTNFQRVLRKPVRLSSEKKLTPTKLFSVLCSMRGLKGPIAFPVTIQLYQGV